MSRYSPSALTEYCAARLVSRAIRPYVLLVLLSTVYLGSMSDWLTSDSVAYATSAIKSPLREQLNPHHLIYNPVLSLLLHLLGAAVADAAALRILQLANVAVSVAAVYVCFLVLREVAPSTLTAYLLSAVLAFANAFWAYAFQIEVYNWTMLLVLLSVYALLREPVQPRYQVVGPVALAIAMLFHQTVILAAVAIGATFLWRNVRRGVTIRYALIPITVTVVIYIAAAAYAGSRLTLPSLWRFATAYAHKGMWGTVRATNYRNSAYGFISSILSIEAGVRRWIVVLAMLSGAVFLGVRTRRVSTYLRKTLRASWSPLASIAVTWCMVHSLFVWWWDPGNPEFWMLILPALLIVAAVLSGGFPAGSKAYQTVVLAQCAVLLLELTLNAGPILESRMAANAAAAFARQVATDLGPSDMLLVVGEGPPDAYLTYYCSCHIVRLRYLRSTSQVTTDEVISRLTELFAQTKERQGRIFVHSDVMTGDAGQLQLFDLLPLDVTAFRNWLQSFEWTEHQFDYASLFEPVSD